MLANLFNDPALFSDFQISFSFRFSEEYESGFRARVHHDVEVIPLSLLDLEVLLGRIRFRPARIAARILADILLLKYLYVWLNSRSFRRLFQGRHIDVLHINNGGYPAAYSCMSAVLAARMIGITNIVYVVNNVAASYLSPRRWLDWPLDRVVRGAVTTFVCGSQFARDRISAVLRLEQGQAICIPNGVAPQPVTESGPEFLSRNGIPNERVIIGIGAVLERRKGHLVLFRAMEMIRQRFGEDAVPLLLVAGVGSLAEKLQAYVVERGLASRVRFLGYQRKMFDLLNALDVLVLPSLSHEDFPIVILEAMSLAKPVIGTRVCGIPEQVEDRKTGLIVMPGDADALAEAIHKLAQSPQLRRSMGDAARRRFTELFSASASVRCYQDLYRSIIVDSPRSMARYPVKADSTCASELDS